MSCRGILEARTRATWAHTTADSGSSWLSQPFKFNASSILLIGLISAPSNPRARHNTLAARLPLVRSEAQQEQRHMDPLHALPVAEAGGVHARLADGAVEHEEDGGERRHGERKPHDLLERRAEPME